MKRWIGKGLPKYQAGYRERVLLKLEDIDAWLTKKTVSKVDVAALVEQSIVAVTQKRVSAV